MAAIDAGAIRADNGQPGWVTGYVTAVPRRGDGEVRVRVDTPQGRLVILAPEPVPDLPVGTAVRAVGRFRAPDPFEVGLLRRVGVATVLASRRLTPLDDSRGGPVALLDTARRRAEAALGRGTSERAAALLRGFVLGQDDRIDAATVEHFRRSGLAHLLAVSGQNVLLLALLAWPLLALCGLDLRPRLIVVLFLIALYVPIAGGGPSIQRAGVMGAAAVVAALAERPASRWYAMLLAAVATMAVNPRAAEDVGWQLSFAAVIGIMIFSRSIAALLRGGAGRSTLRSAIADGAAMTIAATLATAPLAGHHFERLSLAALPANLLALPAVAPVMWLGMLAGLAGQLPALPVEPLTAVAGVCAGYIATIASWLGSPSWAQVEIAIGGVAPLALSYLALGALLTVALRALGRRSSLRPPRLALGAATVLAALVVAAALDSARPPASERAEGRLRVTFMDVGQGDATLLEPPRGSPILIDAGPADADVAARLAERGIERLAALVLTHPQDDHVGGAPDVLARHRVGALVVARASPTLLAAARGAGAAVVRADRGEELRSGGLRLAVLWPPSERLDAHRAEADANHLSLVLLARWHEFDLLLTGDAEAEAVPLDPGPIDVLKVAHHGSEDAGLRELLETARPKLAVISLGAANRYGHPAPATLDELRRHGVGIARTDEAGDLTIEVRPPLAGPAVIPLARRGGDIGSGRPASRTGELHGSKRPPDLSARATAATR